MGAAHGTYRRVDRCVKGLGGGGGNMSEREHFEDLGLDEMIN